VNIFFLQPENLQMQVLLLCIWKNCETVPGGAQQPVTGNIYFIMASIYLVIQPLFFAVSLS